MSNLSIGYKLEPVNPFINKGCRGFKHKKLSNAVASVLEYAVFAVFSVTAQYRVTKRLQPRFVTQLEL